MRALTTKAKFFIESNKAGRLLARSLKKQRHANFIRSITQSPGVTVNKNDKIANSFISYYTKLYNLRTSTSPERSRMIDSYLANIDIPSIEEDDKNSLDTPITLQEITTTIKALPNGKSPGSDGLTVKLFQLLQEHISPQLCTLFTDVDQGIVFPESLLGALITVIPKPDKATDLVGNYRPISLINIDMKIYVKILANRLNNIMPKIIHPDQMEDRNKTTVNEFILLGFSNFHQFQLLLFILILLTYATCITGNVAIIVLVKTHHSLNIPMYFFIRTFAVLEIMFVSVTVPKLLTNLIGSDKRISFTSCFIQLYIFNALGETECYLLAVMAFDRDLAINNPLRYSAFMSRLFCIELSILPWIVGFITAAIPTIFTAALEFCGPNEVNHFFCDLAPLQNLACSNAYISNIVTSIIAVIATVVPFFIIMGFYIHIIITISTIKSNEGKHKAFSTCSSHLIVASLFYCTAMVVYVRPKGSQYDKFLALTYTVIIPVMNPFIYTLRNKDVKIALRKSLRQIFCQNSFYM
ncbi:olfactory receptor 6F1-like [Bombina bombina]|uniref:olfactory receptor 6F1-like n=1 Tax=Bombina bombina TaxID=8345 RepID=UPI00235A4915|nr:olfactory receptor 6F1-like [Bombina bombina]